MGTRTSIGLLALLLLVVLQHVVITAVPLRGPPSTTAKPRPVRPLDRTLRALGGGAGAASPSSPENHDQKEPDDQKDDEMDDEKHDSVPGNRVEYIKRYSALHVDILRCMVAALRCLLLFPLDTIKTRLQAANSEKCLSGLYDGLGPAFVRAAIFFAIDDSMLIMQLRMHLRIPVRWKVHEMIKFAIGVPFEVVKQRRQAGLDTTWQAAVSSLMASRGLTGFYMGWMAMALRDMPEHDVGLLLLIPVFHLFESMQDKSLWPTWRDWRSILLLIAKVFVELWVLQIARVMKMPLDVVKTRLMTQSGTGQYKGLFDCLLTIVKDEGLTALFKGVVPRVILSILKILSILSKLMWPTL